MAKDILFTRETFLAAMRREKKRKQEWEEKMNKKLDDLQEKIWGSLHFFVYDTIKILILLVDWQKVWIVMHI